jgi:hypothetical protein
MRQRAGRLGMVVALVVLAAACDWTTVGFDASRSGWNAPDTALTPANVAGLTQKWKAALGSTSGSDPVLAGGKVFASMSATDTATTAALRAFDAKGVAGCTGASPASCSPLWSVSYPPAGLQPKGPQLSAPTVNGATVLVGLRSIQPGVSYSAIQAYAADSGTSAFGAGPGGGQSVAVAAGRIYASVVHVTRPYPIETVNYLAAFDAKTGAEQFVATDGNGVVGYSSPAVANGVLFAVISGWVEAFDAAGVTNCSTNPPPGWVGHVTAPKFCSPLWYAGAPDGTLGRPTVANGSVYVTDSSGKVSAFPTAGCSASPCAPTWTGQAGTAALGTVAVTGSSVFVGSTDGKLSAFPAKGCGAAACSATWTAPGGAGAPSVAGAVLFTASSDGHLRAFDANGCGAPTCASKWDANVGSPLGGAPAVGDGRVFVTDTAGVLHAYGLP